MRVYLPKDSEMSIGGGFTFRQNLAVAGTRTGRFSITRNGDYDLALVCGATMITRETWRDLADKPRILRIDGIPEDSRNRNTGWSRLRDFANEADAVVYQSRFSRYLGVTMLDIAGPVIYNGVDASIFCEEGARIPRFGDLSFLCVNYRGDPNKRIQETIYRFRLLKHGDDPNATLTFVGDFPTRLRKYGFNMCDLEQGRDWRYLGVIEDRKRMARVMRSHDMIAFPSFADPCPNTLIEAMACGCEPYWLNTFGGQYEIAYPGREIDWSLERMGKEYAGLFKEVLNG